MTQSNIPKNVSNLLEKFYADGKRESDGGFAEVKPNDMGDLHRIFDAIIKAKFEKDPDGDLPIEFEMVDRNIHERPLAWWVRIPYNHKKEIDEKEFNRILDNLNSIVSMASEKIKIMLQIRRMK